MNDLYRTIESPSEGQAREKGSRFLGFAYPVENEEDIRQRIADLKKQYHDARHHCYAWQLGAGAELYRANDDGEPSGTAGKPILGQIRSRELTQVLVVVVRYFGGTLLGTGGLIHAYRRAASEALERATVVERKVESRLMLEFAYSSLNKVMKVIGDYRMGIETRQFDTGCKMTVLVWNRDLNKVMDSLSRIEGCRIIPVT
jgi:uncharacterized YigZ family protein